MTDAVTPGNTPRIHIDTWPPPTPCPWQCGTTPENPEIGWRKFEMRDHLRTHHPEWHR